MEYPNIMKRIEAAYHNDVQEVVRLIETNEDYVKNCSTDLKRRKYENGEMSLDALKRHAFYRQTGKIAKYYAKIENYVKDVGNHDPADTIHIQTWVTPSRCVHADVWIPWEETHIRRVASGYGHNRETTATAMALSASPSVMRIVYDAWEEALARNPDIRIHDFYCGCFYGNSVPEFVGRATMSYFEEFFKSRYYKRIFHFCNDPRETSVWVFTRYDADETKGRC